MGEDLYKNTQDGILLWWVSMIVKKNLRMVSSHGEDGILLWWVSMIKKKTTT